MFSFNYFFMGNYKSIVLRTWDLNSWTENMTQNRHDETGHKKSWELTHIKDRKTGLKLSSSYAFSTGWGKARLKLGGYIQVTSLLSPLKHGSSMKSKMLILIPYNGVHVRWIFNFNSFGLLCYLSINSHSDFPWSLHTEKLDVFIRERVSPGVRNKRHSKLTKKILQLQFHVLWIYEHFHWVHRAIPHVK